MENNDLNQKNIKAEEPIVIGELKKQKNLGPVGVLVFFSLLIGFTIFLPNITEYINNYKNPENDIKTVVEEEKEKDNTKEDNKEIIYYDLANETNFTIDNLLFSNFNKENNILSFTVSNNKANTYSFENNNYFVELYNKDLTLLERIKISNSQTIAQGEAENIYLNYKDANASKLIIVNIEEGNYPNINLKEDENKISKLNCTDNLSTLEYVFYEDKLNKITESLILNNTNNNYSTLLEKYRNLNLELNEISDVDVTYIETLENFSFSLVIDYNKVNSIPLSELKYYKKNTESKVIKFELESSDFSCS